MDSCIWAIKESQTNRDDEAKVNDLAIHFYLNILHVSYIVVTCLNIKGERKKNRLQE